MAPALLTCLPTMQLVCSCLVATGNSSGGKSLSIATAPGSSTPALSLPSGYVAYPDFSVAFKVYSEAVTWYVANARCAQEGAYLGILDSFTKIELVKREPAAVGYNIHVGFQLIDGNNTTWYSVKTGLPVAKLPWGSGEPSGGGLCATTLAGGIGLAKYPCTHKYRYVCEIPYP